MQLIQRMHRGGLVRILLSLRTVGIFRHFIGLPVFVPIDVADIFREVVKFGLPDLLLGIDILIAAEHGELGKDRPVFLR